MIATNVNRNRNYDRQMAMMAAVQSAHKTAGEQNMGKWIASQITSLNPADEVLANIGEELMAAYGAWEYVNVGSSQMGLGIDWRCEDEEAVSMWAAYYYLKAQGYPVPAAPDYDGIAEVLGREAENIVSEVENIVALAAEYVRDNGVMQ